MKLSDIGAGEMIAVDGGFTCMPAAANRLVLADDAGRLYVSCRGARNSGALSERHYLDGQEDEAGELVGLSRPNQ